MFILLRQHKIQLIRWLKFLITGGSALVLDLAIYTVLTRWGGVYYLVSRCISLGIAIGWNFSLNRHWTFQARTSSAKKQFIRFLVVIGSTSLLSLILMRVGVTYLYLYDLLVILIVAIITTCINYLAHHFWTYAEKREVSES